MPGTSTAKRRKVRRATPTRKEMQASWPAERIPVEIFNLIISYLPRSTIQNMRLVNKEFEEKVTAYLFRTVVVPFKSEIYGIASESSIGLENPSARSSVMLQDRGMRVFQGFGRHILQFAMSFEIDENKLARPPTKSDQEEITSFWGTYKWPFKKYNRYSQLEGLELAADETRTMTKALRYITNARELALSIDGGIGWLAGPDKNPKVMERGSKYPVFGQTRFVPEPKYGVRNKKNARKTKLTPQASDTRYHITSQPITAPAEFESVHRETTETLNLETGLTDQLYLQPDTPPAVPDRDYTPSSSPMTAAGEGVTDSDDNEVELLDISSEDSGYPLKPRNLTLPQREMLLEIEWAQRAFVQSYSIAIIDNPQTFKHIDTLTIARLPHRQISLFRRPDFWDSLPHLRELSLGIIPDWREVTKLPTSWVQDISLLPSSSVAGVFQLFTYHIAHRKNITTLHFEWVGGGEEAPGIFARNRHVLPAPLIPKASGMVNRKEEVDVLLLPYIQHFSLKNCWISPHILVKFTRIHQQTLGKLSLDSVSLTASLRHNANPGPVQENADAFGFVHIVQQPNFQAPQGVIIHNHLLQANQPALANQQLLALWNAMIAGPPNQQPQLNNTEIAQQNWFKQPRMGSWAWFLESTAPNQKLQHIRQSNEIEIEPPSYLPSRLAKIKFESCGYVKLPLDFDQSMLDRPAARLTESASSRKKELEEWMMKTDDSNLGVIANYIDPVEEMTLENAWDLKFGWPARRKRLITEAKADGLPFPGKGRFSGEVDIPATLPDDN
ncbi:hypothetical protein F5884DRAFT_724122 [Xylogone sp. PMI_703]|nr:hypothetical protein F5884DRAFT_724122 [Xylogone sp. PMI_703]